MERLVTSCKSYDLVVIGGGINGAGIAAAVARAIDARRARRS